MWVSVIRNASQSIRVEQTMDIVTDQSPPSGQYLFWSYCSTLSRSNYKRGQVDLFLQTMTTWQEVFFYNMKYYLISDRSLCNLYMKQDLQEEAWHINIRDDQQGKAFQHFLSSLFCNDTAGRIIYMIKEWTCAILFWCSCAHTKITKITVFSAIISIFHHQRPWSKNNCRQLGPSSSLGNLEQKHWTWGNLSGEKIWRKVTLTKGTPRGKYWLHNHHHPGQHQNERERVGFFFNQFIFGLLNGTHVGGEEKLVSSSKSLLVVGKEGHIILGFNVANAIDIYMYDFPPIIFDSIIGLIFFSSSHP